MLTAFLSRLLTLGSTQPCESGTFFRALTSINAPLPRAAILLLDRSGTAIAWTRRELAQWHRQWAELAGSEAERQERHSWADFLERLDKEASPRGEAPPMGTG
jgi:hypothetical protein